jgi:hypothetical protein
MGVIKWVGFVLLSAFVGVAVYQALFVTLFGTPSFPDAYGNPEAGIFGIKFFYIAIGAPIVWYVRQRLAKRG